MTSSVAASNARRARPPRSTASLASSGTSSTTCSPRPTFSSPICCPFSIRGRTAGLAPLARLGRPLEPDVLPAPPLQFADLLPLLDRRPHRAGVDDAREHAFVGIARNQQAHRAFGHQRHAAPCAAVEAGLAEGLTFGEQRARLERAETPFDKFLGLLGARFLLLEAVRHGDQAHVVLNGGG